MSIDYTLRHHIVTITINRPEARNSLDMAHFRDLAHAWAAFRDDANAWVAAVTGVGHDFCTGADLKKFIPELTGDLPRPAGWNKDDAIHAVLHRFPALQAGRRRGERHVCRGWLRNAGPDRHPGGRTEARFAVMEPKRGLFAAAAPCDWPRQIPYALAFAMELLLTADLVDAQRARHGAGQPTAAMAGALTGQLLRLRAARRVSSDNIQLTIDSRIAAQMALHQKWSICRPQWVVSLVIWAVIHSMNALITM